MTSQRAPPHQQQPQQTVLFLPSSTDGQATFSLGGDMVFEMKIRAVPGGPPQDARMGIPIAQHAEYEMPASSSYYMPAQQCRQPLQLQELIGTFPDRHRKSRSSAGSGGKGDARRVQQMDNSRNFGLQQPPRHQFKDAHTWTPYHMAPIEHGALAEEAQYAFPWRPYYMSPTPPRFRTDCHDRYGWDGYLPVPSDIAALQSPAPTSRADGPMNVEKRAASTRVLNVEKCGNREGRDCTGMRTMKDLLESFREIDAASILVARRISMLGFSAVEALRDHFSQYGEVRDVHIPLCTVKYHQNTVLVGRKKAKPKKEPRLRAGGVGFIVMASVEDAQRSLQDGLEQSINGVVISLKPFQQDSASEAAIVDPAEAVDAAADEVGASRRWLDAAVDAVIDPAEEAADEAAASMEAR
jgi:hypothetical protein